VGASGILAIRTQAVPKMKKIKKKEKQDEVAQPMK
jgi:hypothetical protein